MCDCIQCADAQLTCRQRWAQCIDEKLYTAATTLLTASESGSDPDSCSDGGCASSVDGEQPPSFGLSSVLSGAIVSGILAHASCAPLKGSFACNLW